MASVQTPLELLETRQEAELLAAAQSGDQTAYLKLAQHYQRPLYRLAYAICRNQNEAAVLAQEALARGWKAMAEFPSGRKFFPWILKIVRDLPRKIAPSEEGAGPEGLSKALESLRADDRIALALRIVERVRYQDIAALLDVPTGIISLRIAQARGTVLSGDSNGHAA